MRLLTDAGRIRVYRHGGARPYTIEPIDLTPVETALGVGLFRIDWPVYLPPWTMTRIEVDSSTGVYPVTTRLRLVDVYVGSSL